MININKYVGNKYQDEDVVYHSSVKLLVEFFFHQLDDFFIDLFNLFLEAMIFNIG